jgi:hypothetical protein
VRFKPNARSTAVSDWLMGIISSGLLERTAFATLGDCESDALTKEKADGDADGLGYASANDVTALDEVEQNRLTGEARICCGFTVIVPPIKSDMRPANAKYEIETWI